VPELASRTIRNAIATLDVDVVLCHYAGLAGGYLRTWERTGVPLVVHCHGQDVPWEIPRPTVVRRRFDQQRIRRLRRLSQYAIIIANSHFTASRLEAVGISRDRIYVKPLSVPAPPSFRTRPEHAGGVEILYLGRLTAFKGPVETIRAFDLARQRGLQGQLTIAGDGQLRGACESEATKSSSRRDIRFVGAVDSETGAQLRAKADIFTAHNRMNARDGQVEAFGVSVIEAMADGLPVVTGASGAVCETVLDGTTGLLFAPDDVDAHAEALVELGGSQSLRDELGRHGWERARALYSPELERTRLHEIFTKAIR
jgi:glycosyltransferase involved in cell wall biosynthesis